MRSWKTVLTAAALTGLMAQTQAGAADMAGVAAGVTGSIQVARLTETVGRDAVSGDEIFLGDAITSAADSQMQLLLLDETVFTIGPNAELIIDEFVYDPETNAGKIAAQVLKGAFRFTTGLVGQEDPDSVSIGTPLGTIGIRGTIVAGVVSGDQALIVLIGPGDEGASKERVGRIEVANAQGSVTISRSGYGTILGADGPPSAPVAIPLDTINAVLGAVGTNRQGRPSAPSQTAASEEQSSDETASDEGSSQSSGESGNSLSGSIGGTDVGSLAGNTLDVAAGGSSQATDPVATGETADDETEEAAIVSTVADGVTTISDLVSVTSGTASMSGNGNLTGDQGSTGSFTFAGTFNFGNQTAQFQMDGSWTGTNTGSYSINASPETYTNIFENGGERFSSFSDGDLKPFKDTDTDFTLNNATSGTVNLRIRNLNGVVAGALDTAVSIVDGTETITGSASATR